VLPLFGERTPLRICTYRTHRAPSSSIASVHTTRAGVECAHPLLWQHSSSEHGKASRAHLQALRPSRLKLLVRCRRGRVPGHLGFPLLLGLLHGGIREEAEVEVPRGPAEL